MKLNIGERIDKLVLLEKVTKIKNNKSRNYLKFKCDYGKEMDLKYSTVKELGLLVPKLMCEGEVKFPLFLK